MSHIRLPHQLLALALFFPLPLNAQDTVIGACFGLQTSPTGTQREQLALASDLFAGMVEDLRQLVDVDLPALEDRLEDAGVPWTPGRGVPRWP